MTLRSVLLISGLFLLSTITSCESSDICRENTNTSLRVGFYDAENSDISFTVDSLSIYGLGREDSLIYNNSKNVARVEIPLDPSKDITSFVFAFPKGLDTLQFIYDRKVTLISIGCGFVSFYNLSSINFTDNEIFDIFIQFEQVRNDLNEHIKIFLVPDPVDE